MDEANPEQGAQQRIEKLPALDKALLCAQVAAAHKAERPLIFYVAETTSFTDYLVVCSARSTRHVQGIAEHMEAALRKRRVKPMGVEGMREGHWVLLDFNDVVVHIFYQPLRAFYNLEGLWEEARQVEFSEVPEEIPESAPPERPETEF
ncbi:MAG: ribosome silencing factor [Syntrophobacteria bacterium]